MNSPRPIKIPMILGQKMDEHMVFFDGFMESCSGQNLIRTPIPPACRAVSYLPLMRA